MASALELEERPQPEAKRPLTIIELPTSEPHLGSNRRFLPRLAERFRVQSCDGGPDLEGLDISFGGMLCAGELTWPGNVLQLELRLPGEAEPVPVDARVVELIGYRGRVAMRFAFENLSAARRRLIATWMTRELAPPAP